MIANIKKSVFNLEMLDAVKRETTSATAIPDNQISVVLAIPLNQIIEDEQQPRKDFNDENWQDFVSDVKRRGVQTPIHVRPAVDETYTIIHGARRYRASLEAGLNTIAAIIQVDASAFDDYSQVLENTKRANMAAMDIAQFIQKRIAAGDSKSSIAEKLSENANYVTYHLALLDMPEMIAEAYSQGKIKGAQLIYRLINLYKDAPVLAESLINSNEEITNALILKARKTEAATDTNNTSQDVDTTDTVHVPVATQVLPYHNPANEELPTAKPTDLAKTELSKIKKPLLLGFYQDHQPCMVMLHHKPTTAGFIHIKLELTGECLEVPAEAIKLNLLTEARGKE
ncbi:parB_part, ParB/RepB/Spo0J family partition protein [Methylophilaceae bacterium]